MCRGNASSMRRGRSATGPAHSDNDNCWRQEGIVFVKDKVNLKVYQWRGPGREDEPWQAELGIVVE